MKKILSDAAAVGNATGRVLNWRYAVSHPGWTYYPKSMWMNMLWEGGAFFETPPPEFKDGMFKPFPPTGARTLDSRTAFYYAYTMDSPAMIMRIPDVGSQYLMGFLDPSGNPFDGGKTYKCTLPKDIPARAFWSFTLCDNQTRSMLDTPQRYARGKPDLSFPGGEGQPRRLDDDLFRSGAARGRRTWQLDPNDAGQGLVHYPAPLQPSRAVLRQDLAGGRDRAGEVSASSLNRIRPMNISQRHFKQQR
jgi:Protein of unknown function (DUF1214)